MKTSRRNFIVKVGASGIAALSLPQMLSATNDSTNLSSILDDKKGITILFQGDSITDGNRTRDKDWNHIMGHGYVYLIASRLWYEYPKENLMFYNRGISGNKAKDLDERWQEDAIDLKPDVISILIGVNDVLAVVKGWNPDPIEKFEAHLKNVLDKTKTSLPNTQIVLCEPFILPLGWVNEKPEVWKTELLKRQEVVRRLAKDYNTLFVELHDPFTKACDKAPADYWIWDGVHPMPAGHELIARLWIKEVKKKLSFIK